MRNSTPPTRVAIPIVAAVIAAISLGGCVQASPEVIPTSDPSVTPVFPSDADALAAAEKAYAAYLAVSDQIANDGGHDSNRFGAVVTKSWLVQEQASADSLVSSNRKQVGVTFAEDIRLQQSSQNGHQANVSIYACLNLTGIEYVDTQTGNNPSRPKTTHVPVVVNFVSAQASSQKLLVERNTPWQGTDFCSE